MKSGMIWVAVGSVLALAACRVCPGELIRKEIVVVPGGRGGTDPVQPPASPFTLRYQQMGLQGGLPVLVSAVPRTLPVTLSLWIGAGTDDESPSARGASHLAMRLMRSASVDPVASAAQDRILAVGGQVQTTAYRRWSVVQVRAPQDHLTEALAVLRPYLSPPAVDDPAVKEQQGALEDQADRWWADRQAVGSHRLGSLLMDPQHPPLYPEPSALQDLDADVVTQHLKSAWTVHRMVLGVSADEKALAKLSGLPAPSAKEAATEVAAVVDQGKTPAVDVIRVSGCSDTDPTGQTALVLAGLRLPAMGEDSGAAAQVLATVLASRVPGSARFELAPTAGVQEVNASVQLYPEATLLGLSLTVEPGSEVRAARNLATLLALALTWPPDDVLMGHGAGRVASGWVQGLQDPFRAPGLLARHRLLVGEEPTLEDHLAAVMEVDREQAARVTDELGWADTAFVVVPAPAHGDQTGVVGADRLAQEVAQTFTDFQKQVDGAHQACQSDDHLARHQVGGMDVAAYRTAATGSVTVTGLVSAGSLADPPGREGTAKMLSVLMGRALQRAVDASPSLDPSFVTSGALLGPDHVGVTLSVPPARVEQAVLAVRTALTRPAMDVASFEDARQYCLASGSGASEEETMGWALGAVLGLQDAVDPDGDASSLSILTRDSVTGFLAAALERGGVLALAGGLDPGPQCTLGSMALYTSWPLRAAPDKLQDLSPGLASTAPVMHVLTDGSQSTIVAAVTAAGIDDEGRWEAEAMARYMDGSSGFLARQLVQEQGLATRTSATYWGTQGWGLIAITVEAPATNVEAVQAQLPLVLASAAQAQSSDDRMDDIRKALQSQRTQDLALAQSASEILARETLFGGQMALSVP